MEDLREMIKGASFNYDIPHSLQISGKETKERPSLDQDCPNLVTLKSVDFNSQNPPSVLGIEVHKS